MGGQLHKFMRFNDLLCIYMGSVVGFLKTYLVPGNEQQPDSPTAPMVRQGLSTMGSHPLWLVTKLGKALHDMSG